MTQIDPNCIYCRFCIKVEEQELPTEQAPNEPPRLFCGNERTKELIPAIGFVDGNQAEICGCYTPGEPHQEKLEQMAEAWSKYDAIKPTFQIDIKNKSASGQPTGGN